MEPTWENQLIEARKLSQSELVRHAMVCVANNHACSTHPTDERGFTCACVAILAQRQRDACSCGRVGCEHREGPA